MPTIAPLKGLRVLDFGQVWAGPLLGVYLSDFGAEVIQVTSAARAAVQASAGSGVAETDARIYSNLGRNRRAITLDPSTEAGKGVAPPPRGGFRHRLRQPSRREPRSSWGSTTACSAR